MGATFRVVLPAIAASAGAADGGESADSPLRAARPAAVASAPHTDLEGLKVLVVDDEPDARLLVQRLLEDCSASVATAGSANEAFQQLLHEPPDVLVSDIGLPSEDGYALMQRIRKLKGDRSKIPAIALTAYARPEDRAKALAAGYQSHLPKPVEPSTLIAMVAKLGRHATAERRPH
jgi:CheY-like chemotaxis protein